MLQRPQPRTCVECGLPYGHMNFAYHYRQVANEVAYWSDWGLLCSHACSTAHFERRVKEGNPVWEPSLHPFERD